MAFIRAWPPDMHVAEADVLGDGLISKIELGQAYFRTLSGVKGCSCVGLRL